MNGKPRREKAKPQTSPMKVKTRSRSDTKSAPKATRELTWQKKFEAAREELREVRETLEAIRTGEVDALVMSGKNGHKVYTLTGAEEPYRIYIEHMQEGAVTASADGLILYCNQRFADMLELPLEKVIGSHLPSNLSATSWTRVSAIISRAGVVKHETWLQRADGRPLPVHLTASRLPVGDHSVICLVVTDLTEQKEKAQLHVAKEVAEKANAEKDDFLAKLSHELRTPLTPTLMTASELEQNDTLPDKVRQQLAMIRRNVELEARLIDDLLDLTRIARGKLELRLAPVDIHSVVQRAIAICQAEIDAKRLKLRLNAAAGRPIVEADVVRLQQAVWNLLRNAVKFTPEGGLIEVRTSNEGERVVIDVKDTGMGFNAETGPKLFCAFEQGGKQITRSFGGLGLGLAITRSIMESHRGTVQGRSDGPNRGATFTLQLPTMEQGAMRSTPPRANETNPGDAKGTPRPLRLLLVEDHNDTRYALELILKRAKHIVRSASSAKGAMELAAEYPFDLVISDLGLPDLSGLEMMTELRDRFGLKGIAVSGYGMEDDVTRSREAGFLHHLTKPISMDGLRKLIADFGRSLDAQAAQPIDRAG
jgi:PAS domain S-box-containing protein